MDAPRGALKKNSCHPKNVVHPQRRIDPISDLTQIAHHRSPKALLVEALDYALGDARPDTSRVFIPIAQDLGLDLKEIGLNGAGMTHAPQQRLQAGAPAHAPRRLGAMIAASNA